jgi:hypothetical protein
VSDGAVPLAHGVGRVFESPIPLYLYLIAAATTVAVSFVIQTMRRPRPDEVTQRLVAGPGAARAMRLVFRVAGLAGLTLTLASGIVVRSEGFTLTTLAFWLGLIVGTMFVSAVIAGAWEAKDPWSTLEEVYRLDDARVKAKLAPWWIAPVGVYALFWLELVSGVGFVDFWLVMILLGYSLVVFTFRSALGGQWSKRDPLSVLFNFAGRVAPFRLTRDGLFAKSPVAGLDPGRPMPLALFASVFVLLASTTFDNFSETVGWGTFLSASGLDELPAKIVDSLALAFSSFVFLIPFIAAIKTAHIWMGRGRSLNYMALSFGWSLIPIGVAYVLAHNAALLFSGVPVLVRSLSDPFEFGWNIFGTANLFEGFIVSPALVWFVEIALIVGGHILGVLAAHRIAVSLAGAHREAVRSEYALTALMCIYTISTLWLLAQPLVA